MDKDAYIRRETDYMSKYQCRMKRLMKAVTLFDDFKKCVVSSLENGVAAETHRDTCKWIMKNEASHEYRSELTL